MLYISEYYMYMYMYIHIYTLFIYFATFVLVVCHICCRMFGRFLIRGLYMLCTCLVHLCDQSNMLDIQIPSNL